MNTTLLTELKIKSLTEMEKKEIKRLAKTIINMLNTLFEDSELSVYGRERIIEYIILYGFQEVMICLSIVIENYPGIDDEEFFSKFKGIVFNRNEKKWITKS